MRAALSVALGVTALLTEMSTLSAASRGPKRSASRLGSTRGYPLRPSGSMQLAAGVLSIYTRGALSHLALGAPLSLVILMTVLVRRPLSVATLTVTASKGCVT